MINIFAILLVFFILPHSAYADEPLGFTKSGDILKGYHNDSHEENFTHFICFQRDESKFINFVLDLKNKKVIQPLGVSIEKSYHHKDAEIINFLFEAKKEQKESARSLSMNLKNGYASSCILGMVTMCRYYVCYNIKPGIQR